MQRIEIQNFNGIENASIDIKNFLVLIGEQASGKSTIAKLIYFFKEIPDDFFEKLYASENPQYDKLEDITKPLRQKFYNYFGSTLYRPNFEITYYYNVEQGKFLKLTLGQSKELLAEFSRNFITVDYQNRVNSAKINLISVKNELVNTNNTRNQLTLKQDEFRYFQEMSTAINTIFYNVHTSRLFVVADRAAALTYQNAWASEFEAVLKEQLNQKRNGIKNKRTNIDIELTLKFLQESNRIKNIFKQNGGSFSNVVQNLAENPEKLQEILIPKIEKVLRGRYSDDQYGEKLVFANGQQSYLEDFSSGQKEVLRMLQDFLLGLIENQNLFRIIEEPESHLFPLAQQTIIELCAFVNNQNPNNQIIITTHSPYILSVINNLLFAKKTASLSTETKNVITTYISEDLFLDAENFAAYALGRPFGEETTEPYCKNIFNQTTGVIQQNYLDMIAEMLGGQFHYIYNLYTQASR